jgi:hypothetical protein
MPAKKESANELWIASDALPGHFEGWEDNPWLLAP